MTAEAPLIARHRWRWTTAAASAGTDQTHHSTDRPTPRGSTSQNTVNACDSPREHLYQRGGGLKEGSSVERGLPPTPSPPPPPAGTRPRRRLSLDVTQTPNGACAPGAAQVPKRTLGGGARGRPPKGVTAAAAAAASGLQPRPHGGRGVAVGARPVAAARRRRNGAVVVVGWPLRASGAVGRRRRRFHPGLWGWACAVSDRTREGVAAVGVGVGRCRCWKRPSTWWREVGGGRRERRGDSVAVWGRWQT